MKIGIDGSRAFLPNRTGIEEYSYQVIKNLRDKLDGHQVILYVKSGQNVDFALPASWEIKKMWLPRFWTQIRLACEMFLRSPDILFVPAHTVPWIHPENTIVTIHGLEYEYFPGAYSAWERFYMRFVISHSCKWAKKIIAVSQNTKKDIVNIYGTPKEKITVIYEGYEKENQKSKVKGQKEALDTKHKILDTKYLLFVGRIEERKNIINIIRALELLREKYNIPHKLILAGKPGYGYENIKSQTSKSKYLEDILELGFVSEEEKWQLLKHADAFLFPTLYEGFGIPVLEAQSVGCPVVTSNTSSLPEIVQNNGSPSAMLVDPSSYKEIADAVHALLENEQLKNGIIEQGFANANRFSWQTCAEQIGQLLKK